MATSTVRYLPEVEEKNTKDIKILYLKTTIVVLILALLTVSAVLIWQLLTTRQSCRAQSQKYGNNKVHNQLQSESQTPGQTKKWQCPPAVKKKLLPYSLPDRITKVLEDEIADNLKQEVEKKTLVSISCSAFYREEVIWKAGFGVIDKSSFPNQTPDENTIYRTGSIVKLLTTLMAYKLLQEGKLDCLGDPLHKYAPKFSVKNPFNDDVITVRHILSHTSGLPREVPCGPSFSSSHDNICPINTTDVYQQLASMKLKFAPGTMVAYSNLGYALLCHALFERFGNSYTTWQQWMFAELLDPLRMTNTVLDGKRHYSNMAVSYKDNGFGTPELNWGWSSPSFQMSSSVADLTKLMMALVKSEDSSFPKENIVHDMFKPVYVFPDRHTMFSTGWQLHTYNTLRVVSKAGATPGSSAAMFLIPEFRFGFVLLTTGQEVASILAQDMSKKLTKLLSSSGLGLSLQIRSTPIVSPYTGKYILDNDWSDRVRATISVESYTRHLKLRQEPGYPSFVYLSFITFQTLQIIYPRGLSCSVYALGQDREYLKFKNADSRGRFHQFTLGSFVFKRVNV